MCISSSAVWQVVFHCMDVTQCIYPAVDGHLGCLEFGALTNKSTMNVYAQVFLYTFASLMEKYQARYSTTKLHPQSQSPSIFYFNATVNDITFTILISKCLLLACRKKKKKNIDFFFFFWHLDLIFCVFAKLLQDIISSGNFLIDPLGFSIKKGHIQFK